MCEDEMNQGVRRALKDLLDEYEMQESQFGSNYIWIKYMDQNAVEQARYWVDQMKQEPPSPRP